MKKIILTLLLIIYSIIGFSQTGYKILPVDTNSLTPKYLVSINDTKIDTVGIVITIDQAIKIEKDFELLALYKNMHIDCDSTVNYLIQVVDDYKHLNVLAEAKFKAYEMESVDQDNQIYNLKQQINIFKQEILLKDGIISDKDKIISNDKFQIKYLKKEKKIETIIGSAIIVSLIYLLIK